MNIFMLFMSAFLFISTASAQEFSFERVEGLVDQYYQQKELGLDFSEDKHNCGPRGQSCFKTACENVRTFECDDRDEMERLRRACRGSWGDSCLVQSFEYLRTFEYDDLEDMERLANSCRGVYEVDCISYACDRMGPFDCDDLEEIVSVNRSCSGYVQ